MIKLNWIETKVSYVCKFQMQTSSWLMQRPLAQCKCHAVESYIQLLSQLVDRSYREVTTSAILHSYDKRFSLIYHRKKSAGHIAFRWSKHNLTEQLLLFQHWSINIALLQQRFSLIYHGKSIQDILQIQAEQA